MQIMQYHLWFVMFVFIPGSIRPVRFGPAGTVPAEIYIPALTCISVSRSYVYRKGFEISVFVKKSNFEWFLSKQ